MSTPFTLQYTDRATGQLVTERPRLMISVDCTQQSLMVGEGIIIASGDINMSEAELWQQARLKIKNF